jgi:hypothetical protein
VVTGTDEAGKLLTTPATSKILFGQLLNHSSGLDYSVDGTAPAGGLPLAYSHSYKGEGTSSFFKIIKVCSIRERHVSRYSIAVQGSLPGVPLKFEPGTNCKGQLFG